MRPFPMASSSATLLNRGYSFIQEYIKHNWTLLFNSAAGVIMRLLPAIGGFVYQVIVTERYDKTTVGFINGITLNLVTLGMFSMMGVGTFLVSRLHSKKHDHPVLLSSGLLTGTLTGFVLGLTFALIAPLAIEALRPMLGQPLYVLVFALGSAIGTFVLLLEEVMVGLLLGGLTMARSAGFALVRVLLVWLFMRVLGPITPLLPVIAWIGADALCTIVLLIYGITQNKLPKFGRPSLTLIRSGARESWEHHVLNLALNISGWFVPLIIGAVLSAANFASFSVAWQNTGFAFTIPYALASVLYAAGVKEPAAANARLKQLLMMGIAASLATIVVFWLAMPFLMRRLGPSYVDEGTLAARLIVLALIPVMIKGMWVTIERIHGRMRNATKVLAIGGILELGMPAIGGLLGGVGGACGGWLISQILLGLYFAVPLYRATQLRSGQAPLSNTNAA